MFRLLTAFAAGAAIGAVAGILLAPDKGENTRNMLMEKWKSLKNGPAAEPEMNTYNIAELSEKGIPELKDFS